MKAKRNIINFTHRILVVFSFILSILACNSSTNSRQKLNSILSDTLDLHLKNVEIQIDSINSGISRDLRMVLPIRDSIQIDFDGYFYGVPVILIHNKQNLYLDTLETDESLGWSSSVKFKRDKIENSFELRIYGNRYEFKEHNSYNFIHISDVKNKDLEIVYTNKGYIYD